MLKVIESHGFSCCSYHLNDYKASEQLSAYKVYTVWCESEFVDDTIAFWICLCGRLNRVFDKRIPVQPNRCVHFVRNTRAHVSNALTTIQQQNSPSFCLSMCINTRTGCRARIDRWHIRSDQPTEFRFRPIIPIGDNFVCKQLPCVIIIIWMIDQDDFNTSSVSSFCHTARYSRCARCAKYFSTYDKLFVYEIFASFFSLPLIYASWFFMYWLIFRWRLLAGGIT